MGNCVWQLRQSENDLFYRVLGELKHDKASDMRNYYNQVRMKIPIAFDQTKSNKKSKISAVDESQLHHSIDYYESILKAYLRLDIDLDECYDKWSNAHQHFKSEAGKFYGIRVLNQDPVENLFSFICSQNNHISRYLKIFFSQIAFFSTVTNTVTAFSSLFLLICVAYRAWLKNCVRTMGQKSVISMALPIMHFRISMNWQIQR